MNRSVATFPRWISPGLLAVLTCAGAISGYGQTAPAPKLKEEMRNPWVRSDERFLRRWQVSGELPMAVAQEALSQDPFAATGGEATLNPSNPSRPKQPDGSVLKWRAVTSWGDAIDLSDGNGLKRDLVGYAATTIIRSAAGKARLCLGSDEGMRAWMNGALVLDRPGARPLAFDEDQVEVELKAGENLLLVKVEQRTGPWSFAARVLESGAIAPRVQEIAPSFTVEGPVLTVKTDLDARRAAEAGVTVRIVTAGGREFAVKPDLSRGENASFDTAQWHDGAYEIGCSTRKQDGRRYSTHLAWYKGDAVAAARELVAAAAKADVSTPAGQTVKMLGEMVLDRLGKEGLAIAGNPWWAIHSPLMEYEELQLEAADHPTARARAHGFYRLAWQDEADGSPQFARAYLPIGYDPAKKTPLVVKLHGFNPANPEYVRWWAAGDRHALADVEYGRGEGIIYLEPHGRNNTQYLGIGDRDVLRAIAEAKAHFNVDGDRVYLTGDSMGGWGTWNVGTRHPDVFAALAPIYGGVDYHSILTEEQLAALSPHRRFMHEKDSSLARADTLNGLPILVLHGDQDRAVPVDFSRYNVRMLQRWGYNVRYMELPGYGHEDINRWPLIFDWFLQHRREASPRHVRLRSTELEHASAYWLKADQFDRPDRFMVADAEITGPNAIRLDTQNILALTLSPGPGLLDPDKPVQVVWNGSPHTGTMREGQLTPATAGYPPGAAAKNAQIAGPLAAVFNAPFAVVTGTVSADPEMTELLRQKSAALADFWRQWQRQPLRLFKDTELGDADAARYSLILFGGPEANLVTRKLADRLPFKVASDRVEIAGQTYPAANALVQIIRPHPLNPERHVQITTASAPAGLRLWSPASLLGTQYDFTIEDGRVANPGQQADRTDLWVAGGWFDRNWEPDDSLVRAGNADVRAKALTLRGPLTVGALDVYTGRYEIAPGEVAEVSRTDRQLSAKVGAAPAVGLFPVGDDLFYVFEGPTLVAFTKDASGKAVSFRSKQNDREYSGKRID